MKRLIFGVTLAAVAVGAFVLMQPANTERPAASSDAPVAGDAMADVLVPATFSAQEQMGKRIFDVACANCHGTNAQGRQDIAPPLVHKIYEPSHHGDAAFLLAVENGVRAHHWRFGHMPAVEGVTKAEVMDVVAYVRALQRENGIN